MHVHEPAVPSSLGNNHRLEKTYVASLLDTGKRKKEHRLGFDLRRYRLLLISILNVNHPVANNTNSGIGQTLYFIPLMVTLVPQVQSQSSQFKITSEIFYISAVVP